MKSMRKMVLAGMVLLASVMFLVGCDTNAGGGDNEEPEVITVTFHQNAEDAKGSMEPQAFIKGQQIVLNKNLFTREGYDFLCWERMDCELYHVDEEEITVDHDIILRATWTNKSEEFVESEEFVDGDTPKISLVQAGAGGQMDDILEDMNQTTVELQNLGIQIVYAEPRQKIMKVLGESGCYFLSLVELAEEITQSRIDTVEVYEKATKNGWMDDDVTMIYPASVLSFMTGLKFSVEKQSPDYVTNETEYEILVFRNGNYTHFVLGNGKGGVKYDPLGNSSTVRNGALVGKRIFSLI